jgi:GT2 family glycosyltransferase
MTNELTICWMTSRKDACFDWFCDSLHRETGGNYEGIHLIAIDYWACPWVRGGNPVANSEIVAMMHEDRRGYILNALRCYGDQFQWAAPKPSPWQGSYRQTKEDWFAAANARNTAVVLCKTDWICFVDDLTCLMPGWLTEVFNAMRHEKTVTCGAYRKVREMMVVNGELMGFKPNVNGDGRDIGLDSRLKHHPGEQSGPAAGGLQGNWLFGCSCVMPLSALIEVNGWDERCDGMGAEDTNTGINLARRGWKFRYAPKMMTYESEERHHVEGQFKRSDYGVSPNDKSHEMLRICQTGAETKDGRRMGLAENMDITRLREKIRSRQTFPAPARDQREWYTGKSLSEL